MQHPQNPEYTAPRSRDNADHPSRSNLYAAIKTFNDRKTEDLSNISLDINGFANPDHRYAESWSGLSVSKRKYSPSRLATARNLRVIRIEYRRSPEIDVRE